MKGIKKASHKSAGLSQQCEKCQAKKYCNPDILKACYFSHVEGFKKGSKWAVKQCKT